MTTKDVFKDLEVDVEQRSKLEELTKKQMKIEEENQKDLDAYQKSIKDSLTKGEKLDMKELSKLERGLDRGRQFEKEVTDLSESLTQELTGLGQFLGNMDQYQGIEKIVAYVGLSKWADKIRLGRVKNADVKQNLQTILSYGHHMVEKLYQATLENMECRAKIGATIELTTAKLAENQPLYEEWRGKVESLEGKCAAMQDKMDKADPTEFANLAGEKAKLDKRLQEAKANVSTYFAIIDTAKQALPTQKTHMKAYADIVDSMNQLKTRLEQNIENVTQIYLAVPTAIKTALGTKAASQYDKGMKYATEISTDTVLKAAEGIMDEVATRAEKPLLAPEKLEEFRKKQLEMRVLYEGRMKKLEDKYAASSISPAKTSN